MLRDWRAFAAGAEIEITDGVANLLIRRGIAREADSAEGRPAVRRSKPGIHRGPDDEPQAKRPGTKRTKGRRKDVTESDGSTDG